MINVHERKLVDMNAEKERVIREIESDREETIAQLNRSHEGTVSNLRKELEESARANEAKISGMEVYFQSQTKQITTSYQNNLEESLRVLESRLENIRISENKAWAKSLEEVKMAHQSDVDESNARESALLSKIQALNDQISAERSANCTREGKIKRKSPRFYFKSAKGTQKLCGAHENRSPRYHRRGAINHRVCECKLRKMET